MNVAVEGGGGARGRLGRDLLIKMHKLNTTSHLDQMPPLDSSSLEAIGPAWEGWEAVIGVDSIDAVQCCS